MANPKAKGGLGTGLGNMPSFKNHVDSGKGLKPNSLFNNVDPKPSDPSVANSPKIVAKMAGDIAMIPIGQIVVNKNQPRTDFDTKALKKLAESIAELGIIQPITVRKLSALKYQIISGERRFRASQQAGLEELPAYIREADDRKLLEMGLVDNVQREDLHPIEIATSYRRLKDECGLKDDDIGKLVGKSRSSITNQMRLLELSEEIQIALVKRDISQGHAKSLLSLSDNPDQQMILFGLIKDENLSVRMAEEMARKAKRKKKRKKAVKYELTGDEEQAITSLNIRFNDKIKLHKTSSSSGKIEIKYNSEDELERFLNELLKR